MVNLAHALEASAALYPDRVAVVCGDRRIAYRDLDRAANRLAAGLAERGIGPGSIVALACPNVPAFPTAYFAILKTGATVLPVSLLLKADEIAYMLGHSGAAAFLCHVGSETAPIGREGLAAVARVESCALFAWIAAEDGTRPDDGHPSLDDLRTEVDAFDTVNRRADDTAVVVYTSGTTGRPKGAELTHSNLLIHALMIRNNGTWSSDEVLLVALPLFHIFGQICQMAAGLSGGATLVLVPKFDAATVLRLMESEGVTRFSGVPTMYWAMLNHAEKAGIGAEAFASVRGVTSGGASMPVDIMRRFDARFGTEIREGYGLSETSPAATTHAPGMPRKPGSVGTPLWGVQVRIVDDNGVELPPGERGEVVVRGHCVMKGYLNDPDATADAFRDGWFHTGDIGLLDADGYLFIVDRKKEMIIRNGMNVYPREVEEILIAHPEISLVAVIGVPHDEHGQEVKAVAVRAPGSTIRESSLIAWAREQMGAHKYPRIVEFRDALPMNATGKILKRELS
ncbi:long-chain-fatty-acid--CoA ligase [Thalassobaculum litoreum]|uniref:Long-chain acyl-CoA synthetase n=1 Tax=Thalassobaculum litoreum DSM 18839 TaxID=1123362 RepID=A0A8G2ETX5_9PROT|nr:long-chain fatty acid--CoA ligase [Thalassobaculum litoreum]SDF06595.1 long-chain acyl-CoA synthetase [Thalassobaculum litoreum DSM 18839]